MHRSSVVVARRGIPLAALLACALAAAQARAESRVENPFAGADWYVSPEYAANVGSSMDKVSEQTLKNKMSFVASQPTAFWLDRISAINGTSGRMGLAAHLDAALSQQKNGKPMVVMVVIYDLPGRDCAALASNGELGPDEIGRYKTEYIDPIVAIEGNPKYASLRIVNIVEIDSLPNIVTNVDGKTGATAMCDTMKANGNYVKGVQYALSKLHAASTNTYNYVDAGHHGWLGWDSNFSPSAQLLATSAKGATGGVDTVTGFITNTSNYSALVEPFVKVSDQTRQSTWLDWNYYVDEKSFATAFRNELVKSGMNSKIGMLIDTSRNGWGGPGRPTQAVTTGSIDQQVDGSRVDRRFHAGNWCNQTGAGLGERPQVLGQDGIHAYVWVKPPGESDGSDTESGGGKGIDQMCDPSYGGNARNKNNKSGAMAGAPLSGKWFHAQFVELVKNAYPEIPGASIVPTPTPVPTVNPTPTPTPTPAGDFTLTVSPSSLTLNQGESGKSTILIGKSGGFSGMVALSASGLPNGVTATFSPTPTDSQSILTLSASSSATTGSAEVTITASSGSSSQTKKLSLTVNAAGAASFSLSASPASVSIDRGATGTSTITVQPAGGFSGSVSLSAENLPEGVTASFSPQSTSSNSTVTFMVNSDAPAGSSTVTIVGTSSNPSVTKSTTLSLTVNAAGGSAGISLSASPGGITVRRGSSATSSISVTALGGFTGSVALSASGAPSGVTFSFSPTSASASAPSTATITAASTASVGSKEVTIQGTSGSITGTTTLRVTVTDSSSPGGADGSDASGAAAGGCGCATTGPGDAAIVSLTMLATMMLWLRRRA